MEALFSFKPLDSLGFAIQPPVGDLYDLFDDPESLSLNESASIWDLDPTSLNITNYVASPLPDSVEYGRLNESQSVRAQYLDDIWNV